MAYNWVPIMGDFERYDETIIFKGGRTVTPEGETFINVGNFVCDQRFGGGEISADIEFLESIEMAACEIMLHYHPGGPGFINAGLGGAGGLYSVRHFWGQQWQNHNVTGIHDQLKTGHVYRLKVKAKGSRVVVAVDGVDVQIVNLPFVLPRGQTGIWCMGINDIRISNFTVSAESPAAFVVMQYTTPYNELYKEVIKPVCADLGLVAVRADETFGPGIIIADIVRQITEATVVIADITPANPNVYYEVGYAHALNKPTILIAEKPADLPFDVSPFRVLFYENTIAGKAKVESGLRKHLEAIEAEWSTT